MNTMAGEFEGGVCGENWWNSSKNHFGSSSYSLPMINDIGSFGGWPNHDLLMNMKASTTTTTTRSSDDSTGSASDESVILQEFTDQTHQPNTNQNMASMGGSFFPDTNTQQPWNQDLLLGCGKSDENYSHHMLQEVSTTTLNSSMNYLPHQTQSTNFSQDSSSFCNQSDHRSFYTYNNSVSSLLQNLFDDDFESKPKEHVLSMTTDYSLPTIISPSELLPSSMVKAPLVTQQNHLQVANNTRVYAMDEIESSSRPSTKSRDRSSSNNKAKKGSDVPAFKRPRIETPSPLPTFKVRKEKLGDRVTALQQLVSPFGKTDTASVLFEAIEYIKFLHDQVNALSTPYMKSGSPPMHCQQTSERFRHQGEPEKDLESRGLCLVPLASTFSIASETTADFWTPNFGGSFR